MKLKLIILAAMLTGCAHGKMGVIDQPLAQGAISTNQTIYVGKVAAGTANFSGDKSADAVKVSDEKSEIEQRFGRMIAEELRKKGFNAEVSATPPTTGLALTGVVTRFEHGSAAARYFVGAGAGSSNLYTDFKLVDLQTKRVLSKFEVIATSGGSSGLGSYINAHLADGSKKVADYLAKANNPKN